MTDRMIDAAQPEGPPLTEREQAEKNLHLAVAALRNDPVMIALAAWIKELLEIVNMVVVDLGGEHDE